MKDILRFYRGSDLEKIDKGSNDDVEACKINDAKKEELFTFMVYFQDPFKLCGQCQLDHDYFEKLNRIIEVVLTLAIDAISEFSNFSNQTSELIWSVEDRERLLIFVARIFWIHFPLYICHRQTSSDEDDVSIQDLLPHVQFYCTKDAERSTYLLRNVCFFCDSNGLTSLKKCIETMEAVKLPIALAHALFVLIVNLRSWLNDATYRLHLIPMKPFVFRYLCSLSDPDLKIAISKNTFDIVFSIFKEPVLLSSPSFNIDVLNLSLRCLSSSYLNARIVGIVQINDQIVMSEQNSKKNSSRNDNLLAEWLMEHNIINIIFGPTMHLEIVRQCNPILFYLVERNMLTTDNINVIWSALQRKHCAKQILDTLNTIHRCLFLQPVLHLLQLLAMIPPEEHTDQTLQLTSSLTNVYWNAIKENSKNNTNKSENSDDVKTTADEEEDEEYSDSDNEDEILETHHFAAAIPQCLSNAATYDDDDEYDEEERLLNKRHYGPSAVDLSDEEDEIDDHFNENFHPSHQDVIENIDVGPDILQSCNCPVHGFVRAPSTSLLQSKRSKSLTMPTNDAIKEQKSAMLATDDEIEEQKSHKPCQNLNDFSTNGSRGIQVFEVPSKSPLNGSLASDFDMDVFDLPDLCKPERIIDCSSSMASQVSPKNMQDFDEQSNCDYSEMKENALSVEGEESAKLCRCPSSAKRNRSKQRQNSPKKKFQKLDDSFPVHFSINDVALPGRNILWDLLQEENFCRMSDKMKTECENVFSQLVCNHPSKRIRFRFLEACISILESDKSVVTSLKMLPKLFASLQRCRFSANDNIVTWAEKHYNLLEKFLASTSMLVKKYNEKFRFPLGMDAEISARLQFLTYIFSEDGSHAHFVLSTAQTCVLWELFFQLPKQYFDDFCQWLLIQSRERKNHGITCETFVFLFHHKLFKLQLEDISIVQFLLYQETFYIVRAIDSVDEIQCLQFFLKLALDTKFDDVSLCASQFINEYYLKQYEDNNFLFCRKLLDPCIGVIKKLVANSVSIGSYNPLILTKLARIINLLKTHLQSFNRRFSFFIRILELEGFYPKRHWRSVSGYTKVPVTINVKIENGIEKTTLYCYLDSTMGEIRAEICQWWRNLKGITDIIPRSAKISFCGHEIPVSLDDCCLSDVGLKNGIVLFVSFSNEPSSNSPMCFTMSFDVNRRNELFTSVLSESIPVLFELADHLGATSDTKTSDPITCVNNTYQVRLLSYRVCEILKLLPTSSECLSTLENLSTNMDWSAILSATQPHKLFYTLEVIELLVLTGSGNREDCDAWTEKFISSGGLSYLETLLLSKCLYEKDRSLWNLGQMESINRLLHLLLRLQATGISPNNYLYFKDGLRPKKLKKSSTVNFVKAKETVTFHPLKKMMDAKTIEMYINAMIDLQIAFAEMENVFISMSYPAKYGVLCTSMMLIGSILLTSNSSSSLMSNARLSDWLEAITIKCYDSNYRHYAAIWLFCLNSACNLGLFIPLLNCISLAMLKREPVLIEGDMRVEAKKTTLNGGSFDFFSLLKVLCESAIQFDYDSLALKIFALLQNLSAPSNSNEEETLIGLLNLLMSTIKRGVLRTFSTEMHHKSIGIMFELLFQLPDRDSKRAPKCVTSLSRILCFDILIELARISLSNYELIVKKVLSLRLDFPHYPWDYIPKDENANAFGYVGIFNLTATCYMATCMQHLFMIPELRAAVLDSSIVAENHVEVFCEMQHMFAFLLESERKAYVPRRFCQSYIMEQQVLNINEQKDMTEFFTDILSKLEEISPDLRAVTRNLFTGCMSNFTISLDCPHISRSDETFTFIRCVVTEMSDLYQSLNHMMVCETLDGDNMYHCDSCRKNVKAERRTCFVDLPKILCINTMRYLFNILTMAKEKVNSYFTFPLILDMKPYMASSILPDGKGGVLFEKSCLYALIGVTVHSGTGDVGHYYSFIRERTNGRRNDGIGGVHGNWLSFNDAEVKPFDIENLAVECFGGDVVSYHFDSSVKKVVDGLFERTSSAYMLFYERIDDADSKVLPLRTDLKFDMSEELYNVVWRDNWNFLMDKLIFDNPFFHFIWQMCSYVPGTCEAISAVTSFATKLGVHFIFDIYVHSKEKPLMYQWIELITKQLSASSNSCIWFLREITLQNWSYEILTRCPNVSIRQIFEKLIMHAIGILKPIHYSETFEKRSLEHICIANFITHILSLLNPEKENNTPTLSYMNEYFCLLLEIAREGDDEIKILLDCGCIRHVTEFIISHKRSEMHISDSSDVLPFSNTNHLSSSSSFIDPTVYETMFSLILLLLESGVHIPESERKVFDDPIPLLIEFLNVTDTRMMASLIKRIIGNDFTLASRIYEGLIHGAADLSPSVSRQLAALTAELCFSAEVDFQKIVLSHLVFIMLTYTIPVLEFLSSQIPTNECFRQWLIGNLELWVKPLLIAHNSFKVRQSTRLLLLSAISSSSIFRSIFSSTVKTRLNVSPIKCDAILPEELDVIIQFLLSALDEIAQCSDPAVEKLDQTFEFLTQTAITPRQQKLFENHIKSVWRLFYLVSEDHSPSNTVKYAAMAYIYHACNGLESNIDAFVNHQPVFEELPIVLIVTDHDDREIIMYNRAFLPFYYGTLLLCASHSTAFMNHLMLHNIIMWSLRHVLSRTNIYPLACEKLINLVKLFLTTSDSDNVHILKRQIYHLTFNEFNVYSCWTTILILLREFLLLTSDDVLAMLANSYPLFPFLTTCFLSFTPNFNESHNFCSVKVDLISILKLFSFVLKALPCENSVYWPDYTDVVKRLLLILNRSFKADERLETIAILRLIVERFPEHALYFVTRELFAYHRDFHNGVISANPSINNFNSHSPQFAFQMFIDDSVDVTSDSEYFLPYHCFIDWLTRFALNKKQDTSSLEQVADLSTLVGFQGSALSFTMYARLWGVDFADRIELVLRSPFLNDYIDSVLLDERSLLCDPDVQRFMDLVLPKYTGPAKQAEHVSRLTFDCVKDDDNYIMTQSDVETLRIINSYLNGIPSESVQAVKRSLNRFLSTTQLTHIQNIARKLLSSLESCC